MKKKNKHQTKKIKEKFNPIEINIKEDKHIQQTNQNQNQK